jgi:hypothetical protein
MERLQQQRDSGSQLAKQLPLALERTLLQRGIRDYHLWTNFDRKETILDRSSIKLTATDNTDLAFMTTCVSAGLSDYISNRLDNQPALIRAIGLDLLIAALIPLRESSFGGRRRFVWG